MHVCAVLRPSHHSFHVESVSDPTQTVHGQISFAVNYYLVHVFARFSVSFVRPDQESRGADQEWNRMFPCSAAELRGFVSNPTLCLSLSGLTTFNNL